MRSIIVAVACCAAFASAAAAQGDVIARARAAAEAGRRSEGLALLETHLAANPRDVDARLVYGLILSWDGKYDQARAALSAVLAQAPDYLDARVALMNVEWWSGRLDEARALNRQVLTRDPGHQQARLVQQRLDARTRPWWTKLTYYHDTFSDDREPWHETALAVARITPIGTAIVRGSDAQRFGLEDQQLELEFYPTFRAGSYAYVGVGMASEAQLYPENRFTFEFYQSLGRGFEASAGYRHMGFEPATDIYVATLTKYAGNWMLTFKTNAIPDDALGTAWSYHGHVRRYFGAAGTSFVDASYGHGLNKEEPRGAGDLISLDSDTFRGFSEFDVRDWLRLNVEVASSRQERVDTTALWQTTLGAGIMIRF